MMEPSSRATVFRHGWCTRAVYGAMGSRLAVQRRRDGRAIDDAMAAATGSAMEARWRHWAAQ